MKQVDFNVAAVVADHRDSLFKRSTERRIEFRQTPCDRQRRAGHQTKLQFFGRGDHLGGVAVIVREMFIDKDRHAPPTLSEDVDDFLEQLVSRINDLAPLVRRVVAVLDD